MREKLGALWARLTRRYEGSVGRDCALTAGVLLMALFVCMLLRLMDEGDVYVSMVFMLAVVVIARYTDGYIFGIAASLVSVIGINFMFTAPLFKFSLTLPGYPLTFASMLVVSVIISTMTTRIKAQEQQRYKAQVEEMRANLLRAVSHDLRTPLTSISGAASVLIEHPDLDPGHREALLREIIDDSDWLVRMVQNLLSITRFNAEPTRLKKSSEAAEEVIAESVRKFKKHFGHLPVEISLPDDLVFVPMDAILIEQVITNLLANAALHAKTADRCRVTLRTDGVNALFSVSDNGVGIPPRLLSGIFESSITRPNQPSPDNTRSMGIGLSVCRAIILAHGGTIQAANQPEGGAVFTFSLPLE